MVEDEDLQGWLLILDKNFLKYGPLILNLIIMKNTLWQTNPVLFTHGKGITWIGISVNSLGITKG